MIIIKENKYYLIQWHSIDVDCSTIGINLEQEEILEAFFFQFVQVTFIVFQPLFLF